MEIIRPQSKQPMPPHARRVFKGVIYDVYQWQQEGYDGSMHTFEKLKRADTVVVIAITEDKKILVTDQEQPGKSPFTALLGGRVDEGEEPLAAAQRELLEESGYESDEWELFKSEQPNSKVDYAIFTFIARSVHKVREPELDGAEKIIVHAKTFEEFVEIATREDFEEPDIRLLVLEARLQPEKLNILRSKILGE